VVVGEHDGTGLWSPSERTFSPWYKDEKRSPTAVAFSPEGKAVLVADDDRRLSLIDVDTGIRRIPPVVQADLITALAYAPDGSWVAAGGPSKTIWRIDPGTMHRRGKLLEHPVVPERLEFEDEGKVLTTLGRDGVVRRWDTKTGLAVAGPAVLAERVVGLATAPDGRVLRVLQSWGDGSQNERNSSPRTAQVFGPDGRPTGPPFELAFEDDPTRNPTVRRRAGNPTSDGDSSKRGADPVPLDLFGNALVCVALSNDRKTLLGVRRPEGELGGLLDAGAGPFRLYDAITCRHLGAEFSLPPGWTELCLRPDGRLLAVEYTTQIDPRNSVTTCRLFDTRTGQPVGQRVIGSYLGFSADSRWLATSEATWELPAFPPMDRLLRHREPVRFVAFEPNGRTLLTVAGSSILRRWDRASGEELAQPAGPTSQEGILDLSPDARLLLTAQGQVARVLEIGTGKEFGPPMRHDTPVIKGAFASNSRAVVTLEEQTCRVWEVGTGLVLGPPQIHEGRVETVALGPGGALVYTAELVREPKGDKPRNMIWDTASGHPKSQVGPVAGAIGVFSQDGTRLFLGAPQRSDTPSSGVWDPSTGEFIALIGSSPSEVGGATDAAFSPDGQFLIVGFYWGHIMVYEAATGEVVCPLKGRLGPFRGADEDPDGRAPSQPAKDTRAADSSPVALAISPDGQSVLIGFENGVARLATLPVQVPDEQVPDWLAARTGTNLNPQATVVTLTREEWHRRWKVSARTETEAKEGGESAEPAQRKPSG
jgi:WD40 repeat protein